MKKLQLGQICRVSFKCTGFGRRESWTGLCKVVSIDHIDIDRSGYGFEPVTEEE